MSSFVPDHDDSPPPLDEEPGHPEHPQDPGKTHLTSSEILQVAIYTILATLYFIITLLFRFTTDSVSDPLDTLPPLGEPSGVQQATIISIRATDLTLGFRRIPAGFHVTVQTDGAEWQTSNTHVHVDQSIVEWNERIPLPSESSSKVRLSVYASFELGPILGNGELLRTFEISIGELLDRSEKLLPIFFQPKEGEVVSSCTSLFMAVEQRPYEDDVAVLSPFAPSISCDMHALILRTDAGHRLLARYRRMQNYRNLNQSIKHFERASDLCPADHPYRPATLFNLATAKFVSCQVNNTFVDLVIPIALFQDVLDLRPTGHPDRPITQLHLATALMSRFAKGRLQTDADAAEKLLREVLHVCHAQSHIYRAALLAIETSTLHPARSTDATTLGTEGPIASVHPWSPDELALQAMHCDRTDDPDALDEVISLHHDALVYYNTTNPRRGQLLSNLGSVLLTRFQRQFNIQDLDEARALHREALALFPDGHPDRSASLNNLVTVLSTCFKHRGNDQDLDEAIALQREALALHLVGHPDQPMLLNNLGTALSARFKHRGHDEDLDEAITLQREALASRPVGHLDRSVSLNNLANTLSVRFEHRGNDQDLDEAIMLHREALSLLPVGRLDRSASLDNLASTLSTRFEHRGNDGDLDQAIAFQREALALRPVGDTDRSGSLNHLATSLSVRFEHRGNDEDLDQAIALHREALALRPVGHTDRSGSLNHLATSLSVRFEHRGNDEDLDQAIALQREALALRPFSHTDRSASLDNLASALSTRFKHRGNDEDLDEAIALHREALALRPVGHTDRSRSLNNLATQLSARFDNRRNREDLDESRENLCCALTLLTQHDPYQLKVHVSLATVYLSFHHSGLHGTSPGKDTDSLDVAMHHLKAAGNVVSGGLLPRLQASLRWVHHACQHSHGTELEAYATSMQLLDAYMSVTASVSCRYNVMKNFPRTLAVDAASCALRSGDVCRAVELLEQGRTVIWTQMARLRTPLDNLQTCGDHAVALRGKFRDLSSLLEKPPASHADGTPRVGVEAEEARYRRLVEDWNRTVEEIRKIEGFSHFLLPPWFSYLQDAARDGPIIMLIASRSSCDAIIIPHKQPPTSVQLQTSLEKLQTLVAKFQLISELALEKALTELWDDVVRPVVENMGGFAQQGSRIWWCPTSVFNSLPLHAAGEYSRRHGQFLSQLYISSYTPSLTALMKARKSHSRSLPVPFAAIGQNLPNGASFTLYCVEPELDLVQSLIPPPPTVSFTKITSVDATKSRAQHALRDNTWLHIACRTTQNYEDPFKSALLMCDQPLSLLDIMQMDLSQHEFVFLSAGYTAVGDPSIPDEVIHLAAGLQFAGVQSVIGTLWEIDDSTVGRLVEAFYRNLCGDGKMNSKRASRALHQAVQSVASDKDIPLKQRIVFIHIGI